MPEKVEIPLRELKTWLEEEGAPALEPMRAEAKNLLNDFKSKVNELSESCEKLLDDSEKEMLKSSPKTYRRARTAYKFARDVLETADGIDIPESVTYERLQALCGELETTFASIGQERAHSFRQISPYFIFDRRRFDGALKKALDSLKALRAFLSHGYTPAKAFEGSLILTDKLLSSLDELDVIEKRKILEESRRRAAEKRIDETERRLASIEGRAEVSELAKIDEEVDELEKDLKRDMRYLQKPFLKFQKLVQGPGYQLPLDETKKLNQYIKSPFEALAIEEKGYPKLRTVLQGLEDAITKGRLKLKRSRLDRAREQIDRILNKNSIAPLHERCSRAFSRRRELSSSEAVVVSQKRRKQLEEDLNELRKRKNLADSRLAVHERTHRTELENIERQKKELENAVSEITHRSIEIVL